MHVRIPLIRICHILCCVCLRIGLEFYYQLVQYVLKLEQISFYPQALHFLVIPTLLYTSNFSAFILKYILSLSSSLSAFYFPISYLSRFPFEVLESFKENSSGSNPKEKEVSKLTHSISWANVTEAGIHLETNLVVQTLPGEKSPLENILKLIKM